MPLHKADLRVNESVPTLGGLHNVTHNVSHRPITNVSLGTL